MRKLLFTLVCMVLVYSIIPFSFAAEKAAQGEASAWITEFNEKDIDLSGLDEKTLNTVLKVLNENNCTCGCNEGSLASCVTHDAKCGYSRAIAKNIVVQAKKGKLEAYLLGMIEGYYLFKQEEKVEKPSAEGDAETYELNVKNSPWKGTKGAPISIVEFTDFQCPYCIRAAAAVEKVLQAYPGQIILYVKNNPLSFHKHAFGAALASLAANEQGKYWEMHDILFKNSRSLTMENIHKLAEEIGLDMEQFKKSLENQELKDRIKTDQLQAKQVGATGTPALFVNGTKVGGAIPFIGRIARSSFQNESLVQKLLAQKVIKNDKDKPDYVNFDESIKDESHLMEQLKKMGVRNTEHVLTLWQRTLRAFKPIIDKELAKLKAEPEPGH